MTGVTSTAASTLGGGISNPLVQEVSLTAATENSFTVPQGTSRFKIKFRECADLEFRTEANTGTTPYWTLYSGTTEEIIGLTPTQSYTFYVTSPSVGVLEVLSWS